MCMYVCFYVHFQEKIENFVQIGLSLKIVDEAENEKILF